MQKKNQGRVRFRMNLALAALFALSLLLAACGSEGGTTSLSLGATTTPAATAGATTAAPTATTSGSAATPAPARTTPAATTAANSAATTAAAPGSKTTPAGTGTPLAVPTVKVPGTVQQEMDKIVSQTAKIRGLNFKQPVERNFMTRADLAKYQEEQFRRDNPPEELAKSEKTLKVFAFVPQNFDLLRTYIDLYNEQVLGFYDPETKKLYLVVDSDPNKVDPLVKWTASHELTHGLQDQYFDLQKFLPTRKPENKEWNDDEIMAKLALVEGDATQAQTIWLPNLSQSELQELSKIITSFQSTQLEQAPLILSESLNFPYSEGANFVAQLYKKGGFQAVNKAYTDYPPRSSSQILHPDKYDKKVEPVKVQFSSLVDTLGSGWKSIDINTMGEFQTRIWLQGGVDQKTASSAANGWAGDRYEVLENGQGQNGFAWRSQWDSEAEATEFYKSATTALKSLYKLSGEGTGNDTRRTWNSATQDVSIVRKGNEVLVSLLPKGSGIDKVAAKLGF